MSTDGATSLTPSLEWIKSSYSSNEGGACIEVAATEKAVLVRDSKNATRPHLSVSHPGWARFVRYAAGA